MTTLDETVQTGVVPEVITTLSDEVAVADAVYVDPPTVAAEGAEDVMVITLVALENVTVVWTDDATR